MRAQNKQRVFTCLLVLFGVFLVQQCACFHKKKSEAELIKPHPVGGYETLSNTIHYPRSARERGVEGKVSVSALVSEAGLVEQTRITETLDPELDQIVANAVKRTPFVPAHRNGKPESVWIAIPFVFALSEWSMKNSPFLAFEMTVRPGPAYKNFDVEITGKLKDDVELPLRIECLLPFNFEKNWEKTSSGAATISGTMKDENGEWLVFQLSERDLSFGFSYKQLELLKQNQFQYKFAMNQALPDWDLAVISDRRTLRFGQNPDRIIEQEDGKVRVEFDLKGQETYEPRYLEIGLKI